MLNETRLDHLAVALTFACTITESLRATVERATYTGCGATSIVVSYRNYLHPAVDFCSTRSTRVDLMGHPTCIHVHILHQIETESQAATRSRQIQRGATLCVSGFGMSTSHVHQVARTLQAADMTGMM
jgi:hypothetical protein